MRKQEKQLFAAVQKGDTITATELLRAGVDPNVRTSKTQQVTPLMLAAKHNDAVMVKTLLHFKADPELVDYLGRDAWEYADKYHATNALFALLRFDAKEDAACAG